MARPMTSEQIAATAAAKALAETRERKEHMADAAAQHPATTTPVDRPLTPPAE
jgi:hypothetical protein